MSEKGDGGDCEISIKFSPPVYHQRYEFICKILKDPEWCHNIKKVMEFGCAQLSLIKFLKSIETIETIYAVDCDQHLLKEYSYKAKPMNHDYFSRRELELSVQILHGSISDPDYRLISCDAIIGIEVIEHLNPGTLDRIPHNIFGYCEPCLVIFTTPNADFNKLFTQLKEGEFRHYDHRFEWSRDQFRDWYPSSANNIVDRYPKYKVEFHGIGQGPEGTQHLGCCSQAAVFINKQYVRKNVIVPEENTNVGDKIIPEELDIKTFKYIDKKSMIKIDKQNIESKCIWDNINWDLPNLKHYKLIDEHIYPNFVDERSYDNKILDEVNYNVSLYTSFQEAPIDTSEWIIPLNKIIPTCDKLQIDLESLKELLLKNGYKIENESLIYDPSNYYCSSESDNSSIEETQQNQDFFTNINEDIEDWNNA